MNVFKTKLHNKMKYESFMDAMMLLIERDVAMTISTDSILDDLRFKIMPNLIFINDCIVIY